MEIKKDYTVYQLYDDSWSGARDTLNTIMKNNKEDEFVDLFHSVFDEQIPTLTEVNDWLWFDDDWILAILDITDEEDEID
jgi:hypothetical protein